MLNTYEKVAIQKLIRLFGVNAVRGINKKQGLISVLFRANLAIDDMIDSIEEADFLELQRLGYVKNCIVKAVESRM